ncbi:serine protein kinase RIO [Candidatus Micrarchaeota archaeon]|nr:serine protein kinase RIO [Candidatus Micrarchaeota archaeon]
MARRVSKRKAPSKEDYQLKERTKLESYVFDRRIMLLLSSMIKKGILGGMDYPISTGKEANVFRATTPDGTFVAVKIYKITTAGFEKKMSYLEGDPRFGMIKRNEREIVKLFARKEFKNLQICERAGVHAPRPFYLSDDIVVMEFLGEEGMPYATMNMLGPRGESDLDSILEDIRKMYRAGLVHADISEYNVMLGPVPYLIDFGQGVVLAHPNAEKFLERDIRNILHYFEKFGITRDFEKTMKWIKG